MLFDFPNNFENLDQTSIISFAVFADPKYAQGKSDSISGEISAVELIVPTRIAFVANNRARNTVSFMQLPSPTFKMPSRMLRFHEPFSDSMLKLGKQLTRIIIW